MGKRVFRVGPQAWLDVHAIAGIRLLPTTGGMYGPPVQTWEVLLWGGQITKIVDGYGEGPTEIRALVEAFMERTGLPVGGLETE